MGVGESWHTLSVLVPRKLAGGLGSALMKLGAVGVQEDNPPGAKVRYRQPWDKGPAPRKPKNILLRAWFSKRPAEKLLLPLLPEGVAPEWAIQREEDWGEDWKKNFDTLIISEKLVITPPWKPIKGAVVIEPGNAFGTGEHPTTRACLRGVDRLAVPGQRLLDVGCGSGILALAGARLGMVAEGIDIDPDAVRSAQEAATLNGLEATFSTLPIQKVTGVYDLVVANLFAEVLVELAPDLLRVAAGPLVFAGILADRAQLVRARFAERPCLLDETEEDWVSLTYGPAPS